MSNRSKFVVDAPLVLKALRYAQKYHRGQVRKGSGQPYFYHPLTVALVLANCKRSKHLTELICAAILHDTIEDTNLTFAIIAREFSPLVASLVGELTNDPQAIKQLGKLSYHCQKLVGISSWALYIKLADRLHNISDQPTQEMIRDTLALMRHLRRNRRLTATQAAMVDEIVRICKAAS